MSSLFNSLLTGLSGSFLAVAVIGVLLLVVGLIKKVKFVIKLGLIVAVVAFIATGGIAFLAP